MKIGIIGYGNVGKFLVAQLSNNIENEIFVFSRSSKIILDRTNVFTLQDIKDLEHQFDIIILCVNDDQIQIVSEQLPVQHQTIVLHCSGATSKEILHKHPYYGVIWPIYSISNAVHLDRKVPFAIQSNHDDNIITINRLMNDITENYSIVDDLQKQYLHLNAVLVNNFVNHLFAVSQQICTSQNIDFELLKPIIQQTFQNGLQAHPELKQTGPAIRNDQNTMHTHLKLIQNMPEWQSMYQAISNSILKTNWNEQ